MAVNPLCEYYFKINTSDIHVHHGSYSANYRNCNEYSYVFERNTGWDRFYVIELLWVTNILFNITNRKSDCIKNYIDVQIGSFEAQRFCDDEHPYPIYSHHYPIRVRHSHNNENNFTMKTRLIYTQDRTIGYRNSYCRNTEPITSTGVIFSPRYPYGYKADTTCTYKIKVGKNKRIILNFMDFMLSPYGVVCNSHDDNVRIRRSSDFKTRFAYAVNIGDKYICGTKEPFTMEINSCEYVLIQFNSYHSTVAHRGLVLGYKINSYTSIPIHVFNSTVSIIIGAVVSVILIATCSIAGTVYIIRKKKKTLCHVIDNEHQEDEESINNDFVSKTTTMSSKVLQTNSTSSIASLVSKKSSTSDNEISTRDQELCAANLERLNALFSTSSRDRN